MAEQKKYLAVMAFAISNDGARTESLSAYYPYVKAILKFAPSAPGFAAEQPDRGKMVHPRFYTQEDKNLDREVPQALFIWEDLESLLVFTYNGVHGAAMKENRKSGWFIETDQWPAYVMWWSPRDEVTYAEGCRRLEHLHDFGPTAYAFSFKKPFGPDGDAYATDQKKVVAYKKWYMENDLPAVAI